MKVVILAGGFGTRLREETEVRPKPLVEVGGRPLLWHILKIYSSYGFDDFIVCLGYKGYMIKQYFAHYALHMSDVTFDMSTGACTVHSNNAEPWRVTLVDTGEQTMTGGRIKRIRHHLGDDDAFFLTYGDGVADVNILDLLAFHRAHGRLATLTAARPPARFGALRIGAGDLVESFVEKPLGDDAYINGGFFVLDPRVTDYIADDGVAWEQGPLQQLASERQLVAYGHDGFWHPMDTLRDKHYLEDLWASGRAPWKTWA